MAYYIFYFVILAFMGYVYETIAMTAWSGKWENRGFLYGPIIPIYGAGALAGTLLFNHLENYTPALVFAIGFVGSGILEYPTSVVLEKLFHAYWWDYSSAPLNINGRVSFFSSLGFGLAALIIVYLINPFLLPAISKINSELLEIISYIVVILISADTTLTVAVLSSFEDKVNKLQEDIDAKLEEKIASLNPNEISLKGAIVKTKQGIIDNGVKKASESMSSTYHGAIRRIRKFAKTNNETLHIIKNSIRIYNERNGKNKDE